MTAKNLPPTTVALAFVDHINRGNLDGLIAMMSEDHRLEVFDEQPVVGREANAAAWRSYMAAFPRYLIYPRRINATGAVVAILGHTTGSHLGLPDAEERELPLIWLAYVRNGTVERWQLIEDSPSNRQQFGLDG
jgi:hypothetical protein